MPFHIFWQDLEQTIILCEADGQWTWDEYHNALEMLAEMANSVEHHVDIINSRRPKSVTPSGSGFPHYQRAAKIMPVNVNRNFLVIDNTISNRMAKLFLSGLMRHLSQTITVVTSLEEAFEQIEADRERV